MKKIKKIIVSAAAVAITGIISCNITDTFTADALTSDEGLFYEIVDNEVVIIGNSSSTETSSITIPETIDGYPVTTIQSMWGNLEEINIPLSVTTIESKAFSNLSSLKTITIPESVTEIGTYIFDGCDKLEYCNFNAAVNEIPKGTFTDCISIKNIDYSKTITAFGESAFTGCTSLESVEFPKQMTEISDYLFNGCSSLNNFIIPDNITRIGKYSFNGCEKITQIEIPESITEIGEYAFADCSAITELTVPDSISVINDGLFSGCSSLENLLLPTYAQNTYEETTAIFCRSLFRNCTNLKHVTLPYGIEDIGDSCFDGCTSLESIIIPDTVKTIDNNAFRNCSSLKEINIPHKTTIYGSETFSGCSSLKTLYIPETNYYFGQYSDDTFLNCSSLESIYLPNTSSIDSAAFKGCNNLKEIYCCSLNDSFYGTYIGYSYDSETDTYTKIDDFKIYCREDSNAMEYAIENGFDYEILNGFEVSIKYISTYNESTETPDITTTYNPETEFIHSDGEYRVSNADKRFDTLDDILDIVLATNITKDNLKNPELAPTDVTFDGISILDIYNTVTYSLELFDDGIYYLCIHAEGTDIAQQQIDFGKINVMFDFYSDAEDKYIMGDINNDNEFNIADVVLLQKWLASDSEAVIENWLAGDFCDDEKLNVIDLVLMKRYLIALNNIQ